MEVSDARKLKGLEDENRRLKKLLAESDAARATCKKLLTPRLRRKAAAWAMTETSHSQRRACALVGMDPKTYRYESRRPDDAGIRKRLRELAEQRRRFGYRRLHILLAREGIRLNHKKLYRIYREERLRKPRWSLDVNASDVSVDFRSREVQR